MNKQYVDIKENNIHDYGHKLLSLLLKDHSSNRNIIWATSDYERRGKGYEKESRITQKLITGKNGEVIKPRIEKSKNHKISRVKNIAEVFTPSWTCNIQNNLIDNLWFNSTNVFNQEKKEGWITNKNKIAFPKEKNWQNYIEDTRLEITCGEAPYIISRYDTITGEYIDVNNRIGILDRKLRIVNENIHNEEDWLYWAKKALENVYGFEYQGDSLLIARENILFTYIDFYEQKFNETPDIQNLYDIVKIISWNIWQMDATTYVIPYSCHNERKVKCTLFEKEIIEVKCPGCKHDDITEHNGIYAKIKDWKTGRTIRFLDLIINEE